jgi:hypothetical protein
MQGAGSNDGSAPFLFLGGTMSDAVATEQTELERKSVDHYSERFKELDDQRTSWVKEWKLITKYVFPRRSVFLDSKGRAERVGNDIYDGTALGALNLFANGIMGYFISSAYPWFKVNLPWARANELPGVRNWLDEIERILYDDFHRSNFYEETVEILKDSGALGTAALLIEEDLNDNVPKFLAIHPKEFFIDVDRYGKVNTLYRRFWVSVREMIERYGEDAVSDRVRQLYQNHQFSEKVAVVHAVEPREERDVSSLKSIDKPWASVYFEEDGSHLLSESGYDVFPYFVLRISTNSDEVYGRGPGNDALVDVMRINKVSKDLLKFSNRAADPPYNVPQEMRNRTDKRPGGENYYSRPDMIMQPIQTGGDFPIALDREERISQRIEDHFMVDFFLMLQRAGMAKMTATEVMERQAEKAAVLGTLIGRIASDFLDPVIQAMFAFAMRAGRVPAPPESLRIWMIQNGHHKGMLKVEYIGPLAQAQRKFHVTQGTMQALNVILPYAQFEPKILHIFKWFEIARDIAEAQGMPARLLKDEKELAMVLQQLAQAEQAAQQQAMAMQGAEQYQKMVKAPEEGSPVAGIGEMMAQAVGGGRPSEQAA